MIGPSLRTPPYRQQPCLDLLTFSGSSSFPDIFFAPYLFTFFCTREVFQDLYSDYLAILLTVPLSLFFRPDKQPFPKIFRKVVGMTLPLILTLSALLQRNTPLSLFPLLLLSLLFCHLMRPNFPLFLAAANVNLKSGDLLK